MSVDLAVERGVEAVVSGSEDDARHVAGHAQQDDPLEQTIQTSAHSPTTSLINKRSSSGSGCEALAVGGAAAALAGALLLWRYLSRRSAAQSRKAQPVAVTRDQVFSAPLHLPSPPPPQPPAAPHPLAGKTLVVSDRIAVEDVSLGGCTHGGTHEAHATVHALVGAGAQALAMVPAQRCASGSVQNGGGAAATLPNPAGKGRSHGGGEYGAAVAVAAGHADVALALDELGSARAPAACCGVYAFRPSAGVFPPSGTFPSSPSLAAPSLLAADPAVLLRAGEVLKVPGGGVRGALANYLVAEDYFSECDPVMRDMIPAIIAAVKRWAGPDQAQGLSLCEWLYHRIPALRGFMAGEADGGHSGQGNGANGAELAGRRSRVVLHALGAAAEAVCRGGGAGGALRGPGEEACDGAQQQDSGELYRAAQGVMAELSASIRSALQEGYIFVLPTAPGEAPPAGRGKPGGAGGADGEGNFQRRALEFAALADLAGVPQVTIPLPVPGRLPLSISLITLHKKDLTLLQAAAKLGPLLAEEAASLAAQQAQQQKQPGTVVEAKGGRTEERQARAEACKGEGNAAFKAGRYEEAVRQYTAAVQLDPKNAVYYANRALAHLKLGRYGQAEADCDAALQLELNVKALLRRGSARVAQGNAEGAKSDFKQALALEPRNRQAREELAAIQQMEEHMQQGAF